MAYVLTYTLKKEYKKGNQSTFLTKTFPSRKKADQYLKRIQKKIYWDQIINTKAKSKFPKPIIKFKLTRKKFDIKKGILGIHFETGMECSGLALLENGKQGYDALNILKKGDILQIGNKKIGILYDADFAKEDAYRLSFYPLGFSRSELINLFATNKTEATLYRLKK